jgi:hypothetical protein
MADINLVSHFVQDLRGTLCVLDGAKECADSGDHIDPVGLQAGLAKSRGDSARELVERVGHKSIISQAAWM